MVLGKISTKLAGNVNVVEIGTNFAILQSVLTQIISSLVAGKNWIWQELNDKKSLIDSCYV